MNPSRSLIYRYRVAVYYALACAFSWSIAGLLIADRWGALHVPAWLHYLAAFGPALSAILMTVWLGGRRGLADLWARLIRWRFGWKWWLVTLSPLLLYLIAGAVQLVLTGTAPSPARLGQVDGLGQIGVPAAALLWLATFGFGEETGWRGFAQHELQPHRSLRSASLIVGALWVVWHWPYFLYRTGFMSLGIGGAIGLTFGLLAGAVVLGWLYNGTGSSILAAALWHAQFDLISAAPDAGTLVAPVMSVAVIVVAAVILNVEYRRRRALASAR